MNETKLHLKTKINMKNKTSTNNENGNNANTVIPAIFHSDKQWAVAQEKGTVYLSTLSWTRREAIEKIMAGMDDKLKWDYFKRKYGLHCKKVTVCYQNGW